MARFAEYRLTDGIITNVIIYDGEQPYSPPDGQGLVEIPLGEGVAPGMIYADGEFGLPPSVGPKLVYEVSTGRILAVVVSGPNGEPVPPEGFAIVDPKTLPYAQDLGELPMGWTYDPEAGTLTPPN